MNLVKKTGDLFEISSDLATAKLDVKEKLSNYFDILGITRIK